MTLHIFTSAALNYLPKVSRLVQSVKLYHPEAQVTLALADQRPTGFDKPADFDQVVAVEDLGIEDWRAWTFGHALVELATAIKPFVLERLLMDDDARVIYLDPDTVLFDRLDDVLEVLNAGASVALTPHLVTPETSIRGILDNECSALKHGTYNLGFVAVRGSEQGRRFAAWWRERCYKWCIADIPNGLFTDQRWIDLVPALFAEVAILRSPRLNVAPWNLSQRSLTKQDGKYWVNNEPLGFYHFTGFDSGAHALMSGIYADASPCVQELISDYKGFIDAASSDPLSRTPWAFACFENGSSIPLEARRLYRSRDDLQGAFANPYGEPFFHWWHAEGIFKPLPNSLQEPNQLRKWGQAMRHPSLWPALWKRVYQVFQIEGWAGLMKRIHS
jgi:hypothetical protein